MKSRFALEEPITTIRRGLAIYKTGASPFYFARIWDRKNGRNIVRSTKETSKIQARVAAEQLYQSLFVAGDLNTTPKQLTFGYFANLLLRQAEQDVCQGNRRASHIKDTRLTLEQENWGLLPFFERKDIREIQTKDFVAFVRKIQESRPDLSRSTFGQIKSVFRRVMKIAQHDGIIYTIPDAPLPSHRKQQEPRTFFRFHPLVDRENDEWKKLLRVAQEIAGQNLSVRGCAITEELRDLVMFLNYSFLRPTYSELYEIKHSDIVVRRGDNKLDDNGSERENAQNNKPWLLITVRRGKTGRRLVDTMPAAYSVYQRIKSRYPNHQPDDYLFFPQYENRQYASRIGMAQFNVLLEKAGLKHDRETGKRHSLYSVRHTSLSQRTLLSKGKANLLILAQNSGTSLEMLQKFYLSNLPRTEDAVRNLQSFGD
jgi:hypothetical protein